MSKVELSVERRGARQEVADIRIVDRRFLGQSYEFSLTLDPDFSRLVLVEPGKVTFTGHGDIRAVYLVFSMPDLGLRKEIGSRDFSEIQPKLETTLFSWHKKVTAAIEKDTKEKKKQIAQDKTEEATQAREELSRLLSDHVSKTDLLTLDALAPKLNSTPKPFSEARPARKKYPSKPVLKEPSWTEPKISFLQRISGQSQSVLDSEQKKHTARVQQATIKFEKALALYESDVEKIDNSFNAELAEYNRRKSKYETETQREKERNQKSLNEWKNTISLWKNHESGAVTDIVSELLGGLGAQEFFSNDFKLKYKAAERLLVLDYVLPSPQAMPDMKACRYILSEDEFRETKVSKTELRNLYEGTCYQLALAVVHSIFAIDNCGNFEAIALNGVVHFKDSATGKDSDAVILSAIFDKETFSTIDLEYIDPKTCFRKFKGVSASNLVGLAPVAPIVSLNTEDKRFIDARSDTSTSARGQNIAAMHWEDFEHLIREVFEREFASRGAEVKVTKASSDGGVDAVVFDPDPIMGGKIVIQAKRYTNVVDLSAVRDLYGTVLNEGASRLRTHNQNMTVAARAMAERKTSGQRSYRVATRRQSFRRPNMISIRLRRL